MQQRFTFIHVTYLSCVHVSLMYFLYQDSSHNATHLVVVLVVIGAVAPT